MSKRKYKVIRPIALGSPDYLGRGPVFRHVAGDIVELDEAAAKRLGRYLEPYYEPTPQKAQPKPPQHTTPPKPAEPKPEPKSGDQ